MSKVKLSKYVFHAYHSKRNLTLISNQMSLIHSISIFFQIITFEIDEIIDTFMKSYLTPLRYKVVNISNKYVYLIYFTNGFSTKTALLIITIIIIPIETFSCTCIITLVF